MKVENSGEDDDIGVVKIPTKKELLDLFKLCPQECTNEQIRSVSFFYNVGLASVNKTVKNKVLMQSRDVWSVLEQPLNWAGAMAYAMTLIEKISDLENTKANYKNGDAKKSRKKSVTKETKILLPVLFYVNNDLFAEMRVGDKAQLKATRIRFARWEKKVGVMGSTEISAAKKRPSVEPFSQLDGNKLPKLTDNIFVGYAKRKEMAAAYSLGNQEEDDFFLDVVEI